MRPFCVRVRKPSERWVRFPAEGSPPPADSRLDRLQLLREAPEFLGMIAPDRPPPRVALVLPPSTSGRVLVAVDEAGGIRLAGVPEQDVEGGLAAMVSDLLAAGGRLWRLKPEPAVALLSAALGSELEPAVGARAGAAWSAPKFRRGLADSLRQGRFPIALVAERDDAAIREILDYLKKMNLAVSLVLCDWLQTDGIEITRPRLVVAPEPSDAHPRADTSDAARPRAEATPAPTAAPAVRTVLPPGPRFTPTVAAGTPRPAFPPRTYPPFPIEGTSPKQQDILARLVQLDDLGLTRKGLEYFTPAAERHAEAEGTIVVAVEPTRWPFPRPDEVLVVIRTTREHLAGFLGMKQTDVEDFLSSLPREHKREHKGALLLRATNVYEAGQVVSELKALKEVSQLGVR